MLDHEREQSVALVEIDELFPDATDQNPYAPSDRHAPCGGYLPSVEIVGCQNTLATKSYGKATPLARPQPGR